MGDQNSDALSPGESNLEAQDGSEESQVEQQGEDTSAPANTGETPSLLDVVRSAVPEEEAEETPESPAGQENSDTPSTDEDTDAEKAEGQQPPDDEDFTDVPFHKHPRFQKLVQQRNTYREGHRQFETVQNYLRDNGLTGQDAADALRIQALLKSDPQKAWAELKPVVQKLLVSAGEVLPQDLQEQVRNGHMTKAAALEVSRARATQTGYSQREEQTAQRQQEQQRAQHAASLQQAAASWEMSMRANPQNEFDAKQEALTKEILYLQRLEGIPSDAAGVQTMLQKAWGNVAKATAKPAPRPAKSPVVGGRAAGGNQQLAPKSILEIVENGGG